MSMFTGFYLIMTLCSVEHGPDFIQRCEEVQWGASRPKQIRFMKKAQCEAVAIRLRSMIKKERDVIVDSHVCSKAPMGTS